MARFNSGRTKHYRLYQYPPPVPLLLGLYESLITSLKDYENAKLTAIIEQNEDK